MILTCPACGTRYVVKDSAIPEGGRQVRCASCKHSWHQDPEVAGEDQSPEKEAPAAAGTEEFPEPAPMPHPAGEPAGKPAEAALSDHAHPDAAPPANDYAEDRDSFPLPEPAAGSITNIAADESSGPAPGQDHPHAEHEGAMQQHRPVQVGGWADDEDYSPFAARDEAHPPRSRWPLYVLLALLLIAAAAAAIWFLAPEPIKQRLGIAAASTETPLLLQVEQHSRQQLASGNQLLEVSGRVINPTDQAQRVPPLQAQLRSLEQKVVYSWTIPPPAPVLAPGSSATFNSAELNIPATAACLDVSFGQQVKPGEQTPCRPTPAEAAAPSAAG